MAFDDDMPDELQGRRERSPAPVVDTETRDELLTTLGVTIGGLRDKAVAARKDSGVESIWTSCEEAYLGIDDSNRGESGSAKWIKPTSPTGPLTTSRDNDDGKSTAFVLMTARYVDMAAARVCEITLPIDDKAFSLQPTPVPELVTQKNSAKPVMDPVTGQPAMINAPGQPPMPVTQGDVAKVMMGEAQDCADKAEQRIWDWMTESKYPAEMRTLIHDAARIGTGALKGPFPVMTTSKVMHRVNGSLRLKVMQKSCPGVKWIDVWNLFPDPSCGEDIHSGDHIFERDFISRSTLKALRKNKDSLGAPIYLAAQIDKVLEEGPGKCNADGANPALKNTNKNRFEIWYFTGIVKRSDMALVNAVGLDELPDEMDEVNAIVSMVNDTVIRATINPLESGAYPYHVLPWSRRSGSWTGVGIAEKISMPQRMVNAGTRALLNNAGVSSGSQIVIDPIGLVPADKNNRITPLKLWHKTPDATSDDVRKMFMAVDIPNQYQPLMAIIEYGSRTAEESANLPLISQGQQGNNTPQTFGQAELQNNNANAMLRSIGLRIDDYITGPLVNGFYEMLLLDPTIPDEEKGDLKIVADGTMAMVEKAIQEQTMLGAGQMTVNPAFGIDPKKWFSEYWKMKRLDPRKIQYTEEEQAKMASQPPPAPPQLEAAKINAEARIQAATIASQASTARMQADTDRDLAYQQALNERAQIAQQADNERLALEREIANLNYQTKLMEFASREKLSLEAAKTKLAETAMKLNVQKELSADALRVDVHKHANTVGKMPSQAITPAVEPAGRAPDGQAFTA